MPAYIIACGAIFACAMCSIVRVRARCRYGLALAASSIAAFFIIVAPVHWARGLCDAIAINGWRCWRSGVWADAGRTQCHESFRRALYLAGRRTPRPRCSSASSRAASAALCDDDPAHAGLGAYVPNAIVPAMTRGSPAMGADTRIPLAALAGLWCWRVNATCAAISLSGFGGVLWIAMP